MSKELSAVSEFLKNASNTADKQTPKKLVTTSKHSAVTRYVCISKDEPGSSHLQPLAHWESVRNNGPVVTQHVCAFEDSGSDSYSPAASLHSPVTTHVAALPENAVPAFAGFCTVESAREAVHRQKKNHSPNQRKSAHCDSRQFSTQPKHKKITPHTWREQIKIIKEEDAKAIGKDLNLVTAANEMKSQDEYDLKLNSKPHLNQQDSMNTDRQESKSKISSNISDKKKTSAPRRSVVKGQELHQNALDKQKSPEATKRKYHSEHKTREYILQQKQKRKERMVAELKKRIVEEEMKKEKLKSLREKSVKIVKASVQKSHSKRNNTEKQNNLVLEAADSCKFDEYQLSKPDIQITGSFEISSKESFSAIKDSSGSATYPSNSSVKSVAGKTVSTNSFSHDSGKTMAPDSNSLESPKTFIPDSSSHSSKGDNSNNSSKSMLSRLEVRRRREELDLKLCAKAKMLSAELDSSMSTAVYSINHNPLMEKIDGENGILSLQCPPLRLRESPQHRQLIGTNISNDLQDNRRNKIDNTQMAFSNSPPTKLKRFDHIKQFKSLKKKMDETNFTINMLRQNNIIQQVQQSSEVTGKHDKMVAEEKNRSCNRSYQNLVETSQSASYDGVDILSVSENSIKKHPPNTQFNSRKLRKRKLTDHSSSNEMLQSATSWKANDIDMNTIHDQNNSQHVIKSRDKFSSEPNFRDEKENILRENTTVQKAIPKMYHLPIYTNSPNKEFRSYVELVKYSKQKNISLKEMQDVDAHICDFEDIEAQHKTEEKADNTEILSRQGLCEERHREKKSRGLEQDAKESNEQAVKSTVNETKGVPQELLMRFLEHQKQKTAATKIQAFYRGYRTRKRVSPILHSKKLLKNAFKNELHVDEKGSSKILNKKKVAANKQSTGTFSSEWLQLQPIKPCPYNIMTAVRQRLLALRKVPKSSPKLKDAGTSVTCTLTHSEENAVKETPKLHKKTQTSASDREKNNVVQAFTSNIVPHEQKTLELQNNKNKPFQKVFPEEADWIEKEQGEKCEFTRTETNVSDKTNAMLNSENADETYASTFESVVLNSETEHSLISNLKISHESLSLPDEKLTRINKQSRKRHSNPSSSQETFLSSAKEMGNELSNNSEWVEASVYLSDGRKSPSIKMNVTKTESDESNKNSSICGNKSDRPGSFDKVSLQKTHNEYTELLSEVGSSKVISSACSQNSVKMGAEQQEQDPNNLFEIAKLMPPEALHLQFQAEMKLLDSLEESRLHLAHIEGLHAISLIQQKANALTSIKEDKHDKVHEDFRHRKTHSKQVEDDFDQRRRDFNNTLQSIRKYAALAAVESEDTSWHTTSSASHVMKVSNIPSESENQNSEISQSGKIAVQKLENSSPAENESVKNVKNGHESSLTSMSEDISANTISAKIKKLQTNSSDYAVNKSLDEQYKQLICEEESRAREQVALLNMTERALIDRVEANVKLLEMKKRQLKQSGKENLIPSIKKRQRALILKMEHDKQELQRLRKTYKAASEEWKNLLLQHRNLVTSSKRNTGCKSKAVQAGILNSSTVGSMDPSKSEKNETSTVPVKITPVVKTEDSSNIQTEPSIQSASSASKIDTSFSIKEKSEISINFKKVELDLSESRHSLLPNKRLWHHNESVEWEQPLDEEKRVVRPIKFQKDQNASPMRAVTSEANLSNASLKTDSVSLENNSAITAPISVTTFTGSSSSLKLTQHTETKTEKCSVPEDMPTPASTSLSDPKLDNNHSQSQKVISTRNDSSIRVPSAPLSLMRKQSSGSDESVLLSQTETPSEQSDLEGRICALQEQLKRRKQEAERLLRLQKKARREKLKAKEQSLLMQIQALDAYINRTKEELEQDFNSSSIPAVKPKIKQPRSRGDQNTKLLLETTNDKLLPENLSQNSIKDDTSAEIPTVTSSEQFVSPLLSSHEENESIIFTEARPVNTDNDGDSAFFKNDTKDFDSTTSYVNTDKNNYLNVSNKHTEQLSAQSVTSKHNFLSENVISDPTTIKTIITESVKCTEDPEEISATTGTCQLQNTTEQFKNSENDTEQFKNSENDTSHNSSSQLISATLAEEKTSTLFVVKSDHLLQSNTGESENSGTSAILMQEESLSVHKTSKKISIEPETSSIDTKEIETSITTELKSEKEMCVTAVSSALQVASDTQEWSLQSEIGMDNSALSLQTTGKELENNLMVASQSVAAGTKVYSPEELLKNNSSNDLYKQSDGSQCSRNIMEDYNSSSESVYTDRSLKSPQLNSTFVVPQDKNVGDERIVTKYESCSETENSRLKTMHLVENITDSIMLQLLKESVHISTRTNKELNTVVLHRNASQTERSSAEVKVTKRVCTNDNTDSEDNQGMSIAAAHETDKCRLHELEDELRPIDEFIGSNTTFVVDNDVSYQKNTTVLVDQILTDVLKDATSDVLHIYKNKLTHSTTRSGDNKNGEINGFSETRKKITDKTNNSFESTLHSLNITVQYEPSSGPEIPNLTESSMIDMITFSSPDHHPVKESKTVDGMPQHVSEQSLSHIPNLSLEPNQLQCIQTPYMNQETKQLQCKLNTVELLSPEEYSPSGNASKSENHTSDSNYFHQVELRGDNTFNNEGFPQGWFEGDLDLNNSWREAEQLRLQQLHIEQEIRRLEEQQQQQQHALVLVREIPDKPPPPYTPRGTTLPPPSSLGPSHIIGAPVSRGRLVSLVVEAAPLHTSITSAHIPPDDFATGFNNSIRRFVFDLSRCLVGEALNVSGTNNECVEEAAPKHMAMMQSQDAVCAHVMRRATVLLDGGTMAGTISAGKLRRLAVGPRWRRRDHVDELLVREARDEEPGWVNYQQDEARVRDDISTALLNDLLDDTATAITSVIIKRNSHIAASVL